MEAVKGYLPHSRADRLGAEVRPTASGDQTIGRHASLATKIIMHAHELFSGDLSQRTRCEVAEAPSR